MANIALATLDPMSITKLGKRTLEQVVMLGDGFVGFIMRTLEDGETQISNPHFQSTVHDIVAELKEHDLKIIPRESLDLVIEKMRAHKVRIVDMVIPFRIPPDRGNYLKYNPHREYYDKKPLVIDRLNVEGEYFMVIAMDPAWEPGEN